MTRSHNFHFGQALLPAGWANDVQIVVDDGLITSIDVGVAPTPDDQRHGAVIPGLPNLHSHAFQRGMAGLAEVAGPDGDSFWTWRETMYRFVDRITPDDLAAIAALAYVEMLESGFTRVGEFHYLHHDRDGTRFANPAEMSAAIAAAAATSGIALSLLPVFYAHAGFGGQAPTPAQRRFLSTPESYAALLDAARHAVTGLDDAVVGVAPHSLRATTPEQLAALVALAGDGPIHIHIAEQMQEVRDCVAWSGQRPVEWLLDHAHVDTRWCLVHATHMTDAEAGALARSGAVAGLCPVTEANLGDGIFPATPFLEAGGCYGIGSDSNVLIDATEELRLLEYGQRLARQERNTLSGGPGRSTGDAIFRAALGGGAQALGVDGGIAVGKPADLVSLDITHPSLIGRSGPALLDALVFAAGRSAIDCVWRRGAKLVTNGRHVDRAAIVARYARCLAPLLA
jgi:formimidoylglutamate deiminase